MTNPSFCKSAKRMFPFNFPGHTSVFKKDILFKGKTT